MARKKVITVQTRLGEQHIDTDKIIRFPRGLVGYEHCHKFTLLQLRPDSPFLVLQSMDNPELGLLVADPYSFVSDYSLRIGGAEQNLLHVTDINQVAVLVTVTIPHGKPERTAINLTGPILINHESRVGLQVPQAESEFPAQVLVYRQQNDDSAAGAKGADGEGAGSPVADAEAAGGEDVAPEGAHAASSAKN